MILINWTLNLMTFCDTKQSFFIYCMINWCCHAAPERLCLVFVMLATSFALLTKKLIRFTFGFILTPFSVHVPPNRDGCPCRPAQTRSVCPLHVKCLSELIDTDIRIEIYNIYGLFKIRYFLGR